MGGGKEVQEGGAVWIHIADPCCCAAEINSHTSGYHSKLGDQFRIKGLSRLVSSWDLRGRFCPVYFS